MTAGSMINDRKEATQRRSNDRVEHSIPTPRAAPDSSKHIIALSTRQSRTDPTSHSGAQAKLPLRTPARRKPSNFSESSAAATKAIAKAADFDKRSAHAGIKDELCKDCRTAQRSMMESVCFITNDGKIAAVRTGRASYAGHNRHCNMRAGCSGHQSYLQAPSPSLRGASLSRRKVPLINPQPARRKSLTSPRTGDLHVSMASPIEGHDCREKKTEASSRGSSETSCSIGSDTLHTAVHQNGLDVVSPSEERSSSCTATQESKDEQRYVESTHVENFDIQSSTAASCVSSEYTHDDDDKDSACGDGIQALNDCKGPLSFHGDNEHSSSEGGADALTTPNSLMKDAFNDLSNIDGKQSHCGNDQSPPRSRSAMAQMRQKYLESLKEQEAEKVRLRKQEIMARREAGDWMLDCHMEEVLHRLAPTGEAHVKVLVEAFETVMNQSDSNNSQTANQHDQEHVGASL